MNLNVYSNLDADKAALKQAYRELEWKQEEVNRLELAVEFGRCLKCSTALDTKMDILCQDCIEDMADINRIEPKRVKKIAQNWSDIIRDTGISGSKGPGPHPMGLNSDAPIIKCDIPATPNRRGTIFNDWNTPGLYMNSIEPTNEQKYKDVEKRVEVFNDMVDAGKIPVEHRKHINLDYMTSFDINILYLYVPSE